MKHIEIYVANYTGISTNDGASYDLSPEDKIEDELKKECLLLGENSGTRNYLWADHNKDSYHIEVSEENWGEKYTKTIKIDFMGTGYNVITQDLDRLLQKNKFTKSSKLEDSLEGQEPPILNEEIEGPYYFMPGYYDYISNRDVFAGLTDAVIDLLGLGIDQDKYMKKQIKNYLEKEKMSV